MSLRERFINACVAMDTPASRAVAAFVDRYEAAQPSTPKRSWIPAFMRDARYDANSWSRWEMTRKMRYFERNVWLVQALRDEHVKWTVGPNGLQILPASSNDDWNTAAADEYQAWCERPCLDSTISMAQVHKQIAGSVHIENDLFIHKTRFKSDGSQATPAIQLIESHRCSSPGTTYSASDRDDGCIDGVQMGKSPDGRSTGPIGYWFIDNVLGNQWVFRSVAEIIHVFAPERVGMYRGITQYHSVMNTLHDLDDLELMEMERAKNNAEVANIITSPSGELNKDTLRSRRFGVAAAQNAPFDSKNEAIDERIQLYRKILGARTIALKTGEKMEQIGNENPSAATQWYWRYKLGQVCKVAGVPLIMIFPELIEGMQGTVVRGVYDNAQATFHGYFHLYKLAAVNMYLYWLQWARYNVKTLVDAPPDWNKCHVTPPRSVNVDIGYTSQATLAELEAGTDNFDDIAARKGTTAEILIRKKVRNVAMIKRICIEESKDGVEVLPGEVSAPIAEVLAAMKVDPNEIDGNPPQPNPPQPPVSRKKKKD